MGKQQNPPIHYGDNTVIRASTPSLVWSDFSNVTQLRCPDRTLVNRITPFAVRDTEDFIQMPNNTTDYNTRTIWNDESSFWLYDDPAHTTPQSVRLNAPYILERRLSELTSWENFQSSFNVDEDQFETILISPQWRMEVERFCTARNITLDQRHLILFGCLFNDTSIIGDIEMPTHISEDEIEVTPDRVDDLNSVTDWREYPFPQHGAYWKYNDILAGNAITTVRIHARYMLECLANKYIREPAMSTTHWPDFLQLYSLSEQDCFGIRKSKQWQYEVDDYLSDSCSIEDTPDNRRFLAQILDVSMNAVPDVPDTTIYHQPGTDYNISIVWTVLDCIGGSNTIWEMSGEAAVWRYDTSNGRLAETRVSIWDIMAHRWSAIPRRWVDIPDMYEDLTYYRLQEMRGSPQWSYEINRFLIAHDAERSPANTRILGQITRSESREHLTVGGIDINQEVEDGSMDIIDQVSMSERFHTGTLLSADSETTEPGFQPNISVTPDTELVEIINNPVEPVSVVLDVGDQAKRKFGVEIELLAPLAMVEVCQAINESGVTCRQESYNHRRRDWWKVVPDASVGGRNMNPMEIVSRPLRGNDGLIEVENVVRILNDVGCEVNKKCGLHVHVEASRIQVAQLRNIAFAWVAYEHIIESLIPPSRRHTSERMYCRSIIGHADGSEIYRRDRMFDRLHDSYDKGRISRVMNPGNNRFFKLNFQSLERHGTLEFRYHSGTCNVEKILNHIKFCISFVDYFKDRVIEFDIPEESITLDTLLMCLVGELPVGIRYEFTRFYQDRQQELVS